MSRPKIARAAVYVASAAILALVTALDVSTGYELGLFILYFIPVGLATWYGSRRAGVAFAIAAALCWYASDRLIEHPYTHPLLIYWETFMRLVSNLVTALTLSKIHEGLQQREDLLRIVSHDLRAPLGAVAGQARILRNRAGSDPWVADRADAILRAANRMDSMIGDLVDGALFEAGRLRLDVRDVDLERCVTELLSRMSGSLEVERVELAFAGRSPIAVKADPNRLERILLNLLSNALKYSPPEARVRVDAEALDGRVVITFADCGTGIAPEDMPRIFDRYYRGRAAHGQEGLGLGLHSTRLLVEAHGGRIEVESPPGGGATFRVELPAAPPG